MQLQLFFKGMQVAGTGDSLFSFCSLTCYTLSFEVLIRVCFSWKSHSNYLQFAKIYNAFLSTCIAKLQIYPKNTINHLEHKWL